MPEKLTNSQAVATQTRIAKAATSRVWGIQCKAWKRNGDRCTNWAIRGGYVCPVHGGRLPTVRASAVTRLRSQLDPALDRIALALAKGDDRTALRAAMLVLRYSGITPQNVRSTLREAKRALPSGQGGPEPLDAQIEALLAALKEADDGSAATE